ncbi:MAG TPA: UDP-N-acetylglucosamine 4-epimerase [Prolixibacteraceae bacterium]|nr:UDP-N-acetylglucosamine 4-epimerase [Prolixibacteraceae bacterium]
MFTIIGASGFVGTRLIAQLGITNCQNLDKRQSLKYPEITILQNILENGLTDSIPSETQTIVLLAAEHRDDVSPTSLYYDVNVQGTRNVLDAMDKKGVRNIVFTSSVAVFGLNKKNPDETHPVDPFNHYGKSKWQAEEVLREWHQKDPGNRSLNILRPTVIFGERNRGNVYNLLKQIASGKFMMVGNGTNKKSMAYVGNVVAFIQFCINMQKPGYRLFHYIDKPDMNMNELVQQVEKSLDKKLPAVRLPYWLGYMGGLSFDLLAKLTGKKFSVSAVRVKKFCATTQFDATAAHNSGFKAPFTLSEGLHRTLHYEFIDLNKDEIVFESE